MGSGGIQPGLGASASAGSVGASHGAGTPPVPQSPPRGNLVLPPIYNLGGGGSPGQPSAAVAYAIQQAGVDSKPLGKPFSFNPLEGKVSFFDCADSIITISDANMPGMEWIMQEQPKSAVSMDAVLVRFPHVDPLLIKYGD